MLMIRMNVISAFTSSTTVFCFAVVVVVAAAAAAAAIMLLLTVMVLYFSRPLNPKPGLNSTPESVNRFMDQSGQVLSEAQKWGSELGLGFRGSKHVASQLSR